MKSLVFWKLSITTNILSRYQISCLLEALHHKEYFEQILQLLSFGSSPSQWIFWADIKTLVFWKLSITMNILSRYQNSCLLEALHHNEYFEQISKLLSFGSSPSQWIFWADITTLVFWKLSITTNILRRYEISCLLEALHHNEYFEQISQLLSFGSSPSQRIFWEDIKTLVFWKLSITMNILSRYENYCLLEALHHNKYFEQISNLLSFGSSPSQGIFWADITTLVFWELSITMNILSRYQNSCLLEALHHKEYFEQISKLLSFGSSPSQWIFWADITTLFFWELSITMNILSRYENYCLLEALNHNEYFEQISKLVFWKLSITTSILSRYQNSCLLEALHHKEYFEQISKLFSFGSSPSQWIFWADMKTIVFWELSITTNILRRYEISCLLEALHHNKYFEQISNLLSFGSSPSQGIFWADITTLVFWELFITMNILSRYQNSCLLEALHYNEYFEQISKLLSFGSSPSQRIFWADIKTLVFWKLSITMNILSRYHNSCLLEALHNNEYFEKIWNLLSFGSSPSQQIFWADIKSLVFWKLSITRNILSRYYNSCLLGALHHNEYFEQISKLLSFGSSPLQWIFWADIKTLVFWKLSITTNILSRYQNSCLLEALHHNEYFEQISQLLSFGSSP